MGVSEGGYRKGDRQDGCPHTGWWGGGAWVQLGGRGAVLLDNQERYYWGGRGVYVMGI